jgi:hypothetical protein
MTGKGVNLEASAAARLLNRAKSSGDDYQTLLTNVCFERFLYRHLRLLRHPGQLSDVADDRAGRNTGCIPWTDPLEVYLLTAVSALTWP